MLIRKIPSMTVVSGIHPVGSEVEMICGDAFSYLFSSTLVVCTYKSRNGKQGNGKRRNEEMKK